MSFLDAGQNHLPTNALTRNVAARFGHGKSDEDDEVSLVMKYMRHITATLFSCIIIGVVCIVFIDIVMHWSQGEIGILASLNWIQASVIFVSFTLSGLVYILLDTQQLRQRVDNQHRNAAISAANMISDLITLVNNAVAANQQRNAANAPVIAAEPPAAEHHL